MIGELYAHDSCTSIGKTYTNPIVAIAPGGLSTVSLDIALGVTFNDRNFYRSSINSFTKAVRTEDLLCPTWGLGNRNDTEYFKVSTVGPPFNPIVDPPLELLHLDPGESYPEIEDAK